MSGMCRGLFQLDEQYYSNSTWNWPYISLSSLEIAMLQHSSSLFYNVTAAQITF